MDGMSRAEAEAAQALLASDRELHQLFHSLVPHTLTAADFWAQRRAALYAKTQQQGFASRRPSDKEVKAAADERMKVEREVATEVAAEAESSTSTSRQVCVCMYIRHGR